MNPLPSHDDDDDDEEEEEEEEKEEDEDEDEYEDEVEGKERKERKDEDQNWFMVPLMAMLITPMSSRCSYFVISFFSHGFSSEMYVNVQMAPRQEDIKFQLTQRQAQFEGAKRSSADRINA